jgi:hypothetical protein
MKNLVYIEDATIDALIANTTVREAVPCLLQAHKNRPSMSGCRPCKRGAVRAQLDNLYSNAKECLVSLSGTAKEAVFEALNARQIRVVVRRGSRRKEITIRRAKS